MSWEAHLVDLTFL